MLGTGIMWDRMRHLEFQFIFKTDGVGVGLAVAAMLEAIVGVECLAFLEFPFHTGRAAYFAELPTVVEFCGDVWGTGKMPDFIFCGEPASQHIGGFRRIDMYRIVAFVIAVVVAAFNYLLAPVGVLPLFVE